VLKNRGGATIRYDSFEHVQNSRGLSRSMPISGDRLRFVPNHGDAVTNVLRMYHGLPRFLKSWTIGTKDRDSVTEALCIIACTLVVINKVNLHVYLFMHINLLTI